MGVAFIFNNSHIFFEIQKLQLHVMYCIIVEKNLSFENKNLYWDFSLEWFSCAGYLLRNFSLTGSQILGSYTHVFTVLNCGSDKNTEW